MLGQVEVGMRPPRLLTSLLEVERPRDRALEEPRNA